MNYNISKKGRTCIKEITMQIERLNDIYKGITRQIYESAGQGQTRSTILE